MALISFKKGLIRRNGYAPLQKAIFAVFSKRRNRDKMNLKYTFEEFYREYRQSRIFGIRKKRFGREEGVFGAIVGRR